MEPAVSLLAGMPVCYIYRQQEGLTERTLAWLEHKADRYTTVYGYMGLGDRYEQHLL